MPTADDGRATGAPDVVVLSPHLDDAVLSLGALIGRTAAQGRTVEVWTAFTAGPDPSTLPARLRPFGDYPTRIAEDDRALDLLGAGAGPDGRPCPVGRRRLGLPKRLWREPRPNGITGAFRTPPAVSGFGQLAALEQAVGRALASPGTVVYAPLGIGHHTDHVELAAAALRVALAASPAGQDLLARLRFYEDFYAAGEASRRRHPVSARRPGRLREAPGWAAPLLGLGLRLTALGAAGPGLERFAPGLDRLGWRCRPEPVDGFEPAKLAAVAEYRSQLARMGGGRRVAAVLRRGHQVRGGELVWRATR